MVLDRLTAPDRAANIPEFVNVAPAAIRQIREQFVDDVSYARAAWEYLKSNDYEGAERQARKALELNPKNGDALLLPGAGPVWTRAIRRGHPVFVGGGQDKTDAGEIQTDLGAVYIAKNMLEEGISSSAQVLGDRPEQRRRRTSTSAWRSFAGGTSRRR